MRVVAIVIMLAFLIKLAHAAAVPVVNVKNSTDVINKVTINLMFAGIEDRWKNGNTVVVIMLPKDNILTREFIARYLNQHPQRFYDYVVVQINKGKKTYRVASSEKELADIVAVTPGAIGYADDLLILSMPGVKQLKVNK
jgi:ABC-type phosphate transport system substrate-binding protein